MIPHRTALSSRGWLIAALLAAPFTGCDDAGSSRLPDAAPGDLYPSNDASIPEDGSGHDGGSALDDYLRAQLPGLGVPGLSAIIVKGSRVAWQGSYGYADVARQVPVTAATTFLIGYPSSLVTTIAVLQVGEKKLLDLDADVNSLLFFSIHDPHFPMTPITSRMLLAGSSTITDRTRVIDATIAPGDSATLTESFLVDYLTPTGMTYSVDNFATFKPGEATVESIAAVATAAYVVERVTRSADFATYCQENVFAPLGMHDTDFRLAAMDPAHVASLYVVDNGHFSLLPQWGTPLYPALTLRASSTSLGTLAMALLGGGQLHGKAILQAATVDELVRVQVPLANPDRALGVSYLNLPSGRVVGMVGLVEGATSMIYWQPQTEVGVVVLMNAQAASGKTLLEVLDRLFVEASKAP